MNGTIYGIDLGTTNSCLAVMAPEGPRVIEIEGQPLVPSVVSLDLSTAEILVGRRARNRMVLEPESTVRSIKRRMGQRQTLQVGPRQLAPEEVAAEILRYLKQHGEAAEGREIRRAVITVPAYFEDAQRRATIRAGELAGLEVVRILNEPTAAAMIYDRLDRRSAGGAGGRRDGETGWLASTGEAERILVYDLGGGTFDVSVVEISHQLNEVRSSCGDNHLGGDDFDQLLVEHLLGAISDRHGRDLGGDDKALARLAAAAETAKIDLSTHPYCRVIEEALAPGIHLDLELERSTFEGLIHDHLEATRAETDRALDEARVTADDVDRVVLVGGSTLIPRVREMLDERFDCPVEHAVDPALCVSLGAAVQGAILGGEIFDHILVDVAAHSLGVKTRDDPGGGLELFRSFEADYFSTIIRRNTQIPVTRSEVYCTVVDDQERVNVEVYQGEQLRCSQNTLIGNFPFDLEPAPRSSPVVIEFAYDTDGIIRVRVHQKGTDNSKQVTLDTSRSSPSGGTRMPGSEEAAEEQPVDSVPEGGQGQAEGVDNYMIRKARLLGTRLPEGDLRRRLNAAASAYEAVLASDAADPDEVDQIEDDLLERLDEAEAEVAVT